MFDSEFKINLIIFINIILIFYILYNKNIEKFAVADDVKAQINEVYKADVDAIRNLSAIASKLQAGSYTCPGNLTVTSNLQAGNVLVGAHEIQLQYGGKAHYGIINDGSFKIRNTSVNGSIGSAGTDLITVDYPGNTTIAGNLTLNGNGRVTAPGGFMATGDWVRVKGQCGLHFEDYGGGWYMIDGAWIRSYGGKNVYCSAQTLTEKLQVQQETVLNGATTVTGDLVVSGKIKLGNFYIYPGTSSDGSDEQLFIGNLDKTRGIRISMGDIHCSRLAYAGRNINGVGGNWYDC